MQELEEKMNALRKQMDALEEQAQEENFGFKHEKTEKAESEPKDEFVRRVEPDKSVKQAKTRLQMEQEMHKRKAAAAKERHERYGIGKVRDVQKQSVDKTRIAETSVKKSSDIESTIGKSVMGIIAACLICISFVLVAIILIPSLTNELKVGLMFAVSILISLFGLIKMYKTPENKGYVAIASCGVSCSLIIGLTNSCLKNNLGK